MNSNGSKVKPSARLVRIERAKGNKKINARHHGIDWHPMWEVVVIFDEHAEAKEFFDSLHEGGICDA